VPTPRASRWAMRLRGTLTVRAALAISALVGLLFALSTVFSIGVVPPHLHSRHDTVAAAAAHVLLDSPDSLIGARPKAGFDYDGLSKRAALYGNLIASPPVRNDIARRMGLAPDELTARSRLTLAVQWAMRDPDAEQRANQLRVATDRYKLELQSDPIRPILNVYAQAPSVAAAQRLADTAVTSLRAYLTARAARDRPDPDDVPTITQLGPARGGVINGQIVPQIVLVTFLTVFGVSLALLLGVPRVRRGWVEAGRSPRPADDAAASPPAEHQAASEATAGRVRAPGGDWPHTTRVMPWLIAGFIAILWLVPFNAIQLTVSLPFDLKFDRMVLPVLLGLWVFTLAAGGQTAPRLRLTAIHVGIGVFVAVASLSVVLNAQDLNQTLEFDLGFKKLTLLLSYALLFVIIASTVRRSEVAAFLKFTLILAVITAVGVIWEYRFHYNVFYDLSSKLLPGLFTVARAATDARDDIGRVMTFGPTDHPLEVCGMLTMAFPIALVGILGSKDRRTRILYGLAACLLLAAAISTYRKSALLGPVAVVLVIAYFRRRELVRLAPLGFISLIAIHVLSPGAFGSILFQLHPDRLGVATVSDRAADYDAIRPDLWSHLAFGRGYGTYDHLSYRILDSEMLSRVVDTGILGALAVIFMLMAIVFASRQIINARDAEWSNPLLAVAAAAVAFLVLAFLFDVTSFPHVPYILLSLAGLVAVILSGEDDPPPARIRRLHRPAAARRPVHRPRRASVSR
jgi:hypothetical protein